MTPNGPLAGLSIAVANWRDEGHPDAGGAEVYAGAVARGLASAGAHVDLLTGRGRGQSHRVRIGSLTHRRWGSRWASYLWIPAWLLWRRRRIDAVVDCQNGLSYGAPLFVGRRTAVVLVVHHVHQLQWRAHFGPLLAAAGRVAERASSRLYSGRPVAVVSRSTARQVRDVLGHRGPVVLAPNGTPRRWGDSVHDPAQWSPQPSVIAVGRVTGHKRVHLLVEAAAQLRGRWPALQVHVVGSGDQLAGVRDLADRAGLADSFHLHGWLPDTQLAELMSRSWLHVQPSMGEGWGLTVLEAAAVGVPSVVFPVAGLSDAVLDGRTGWHVPPGATLASTMELALESLADRRTAGRMSEACRSWASQFSWEDTVDTLTSVLLDELSQRRGLRSGLVRRRPGPAPGGGARR